MSLFNLTETCTSSEKLCGNICIPSTSDCCSYTLFTAKYCPEGYKCSSDNDGCVREAWPWWYYAIGGAVLLAIIICIVCCCRKCCCAPKQQTVIVQPAAPMQPVAGQPVAVAAAAYPVNVQGDCQVAQPAVMPVAAAAGPQYLPNTKATTNDDC